ncbi:hypothetical protein EDC01DRAFT_782556 [Geopyxis carbonaria]|nr:hypothetical protein EDC01DRAFT_782556 [Geopyxis carbonaria]
MPVWRRSADDGVWVQGDVSGGHGGEGARDQSGSRERHRQSPSWKGPRKAGGSEKPSVDIKKNIEHLFEQQIIEQFLATQMGDTSNAPTWQSCLSVARTT